MHDGLTKPKIYVLLSNSRKSNNFGPLIRCCVAHDVQQLVFIGYPQCSIHGSHGSHKHIDITSYPTFDKGIRGCYTRQPRQITPFVDYEWTRLRGRRLWYILRWWRRGRQRAHVHAKQVFIEGRICILILCKGCAEETEGGLTRRWSKNCCFCSPWHFKNLDHQKILILCVAIIHRNISCV